MLAVKKIPNLVSYTYFNRQARHFKTPDSGSKGSIDINALTCPVSPAPWLSVADTSWKFLLKREKCATHFKKMATCTVIEHVHSVLHLFLSCVALKIKLETVNET